MRQLVELIRHGDPGDLAREERDRLPNEEAAEGRRFAQRAQVERDPAEEAAGARRRFADGLALRELDVGRRPPVQC
jgi:hypothetical protein